jgi:DNA-binding transcriptional regulator YiaG
MAVMTPRRPVVCGAGSAGVVSIGARGDHRPDYKRLACGQVATAREKLGLTVPEFAAYLRDLLGWNVGDGVVGRWEAGVTPPGDVLLACAVIAQARPGDVRSFPDEATTERAAALLSQIAPEDDEIGDLETVLPYASRGSVNRQQWRDIIRESQDHLWLYGMAEFQYAIDDDVPGILAEAARAGCQVRVLLLSPGYADMDVIDADEDSPEGTLRARIRASLKRFTQMREEAGPNMQLRTFGVHPTVSIVRGDGRMLITPYLRFFKGSNSPTFELTEGSARKMFGRYARHFGQMWELAKDWT